MGEVWRGRDTRLNRDVALKILPEAFASDLHRMRRFERESRLLASLNHPNIASIYGVEESDGRRALVLELVEGRDLADRIHDGPISIEESIGIARQIAEGLEAAHECGVVHRDLKPANVVVTPGGKAKILDFGLAKSTAGDPGALGAGPSHSPTLTAAGTLAGEVLGTAAYMPPEQAKGKPVDRRADIWSFGVLLFEMLSGERLFACGSVSETLAAVIKDEPAWERLPAGTHPSVTALLRRCLDKDPRSRLQSIGEARVALERLQRGELPAPLAAGAGSEAAAAGVGPRSAGISPAWLALTALLAFAAGLVGWRGWIGPSAARQSHRITFETDPKGLRTDEIRRPAISPDGGHIAYFDDEGLWIRDLDAREPRRIEGTADATNLAWSPDGKVLAFMLDDRLMHVPAAGGAAVQMATLPIGNLDGMAWTDDGWIYFAGGVGPMYRVSSRGGESEKVILPDPEGFLDFHPPSAAPGGAIVYGVHRTVAADTIEIFDGRERKVLLRIEGSTLDMPAIAGGYLLYDRRDNNDGVWAAPYDPDRRELAGEPFMVAVGGRSPSGSSDGTLLYVDPGDVDMRQLVVVDRSGKILRTVGDPQPQLAAPDVSPDGRRALVSIDPGEGRQVWMVALEGGEYTRITLDEGVHEQGIWLPGGQRLATDTRQIGRPLWITLRNADGTGTPEPLVEGFWPTFTRDGRTVVYTTFNKGTAADIMVAGLDGGEEPRPFLQTPQMEGTTSLSPDGRFLVYIQGKGNLPSIYMTSFPGGGGTWQVAPGKGFYPEWSSRGDEIYYMNPKADGGQFAMMAVPVRTAPSVSLGRAEMLFEFSSDGLYADLDSRPVSALPGGESFLAVRLTGDKTKRDPAVVIEQGWLAAHEESE